MHSDLTFYRPDTGLFMVGTKKLKGNYRMGFYPVLNQVGKYRKKKCNFVWFFSIFKHKPFLSKRKQLRFSFHPG